MSRNRARFLAFAALALPAPAAAQTRWIVPDQFPDIQSAIDAAAPGDVVLVRDLGFSWAPFALDKSLTLAGLVGGYDFTPKISVPDASRIVRIQLDPGEEVRIAGVDFFESGTSGGGFTPFELQGGTVTFEDCVLQGGVGASGPAPIAALRVRSGNLNLMRTRVFGLGQVPAALHALDSRVSAVSSYVLGGLAAARMERSSLQGGDVLIAGGDAVSAGSGGIGLVLDSASRCWLSDSTVRGGVGMRGGDGLVNAAAEPAQLARTSLSGGIGATAGRPSVGAVDQNAALLGAVQSEVNAQVGTLRLGGSLGVVFTGEPGWPCTVFAAVQLPGAALDPRLLQPAWLAAGARELAAGVLDGQGEFVFVVAIPDQVQLLDRAIWLQAAGGPGTPFLVSPLAGGIVRR